jgi:AraC-like DNA-binding protein
MDGPDRLTGFLEALSEGIDAPLRGAELAARAHLSRFHFDRVIAAAAGESPGRLRRRILLERAAHRLRTGQANILEVALEAGYGSHGAFSRAFRRAYGASPAQWRSRPNATTALPTPNGVHFHPPGQLRLPARKEAHGMDLLTRMVEHHVWLIGEFIDRAGRLTEVQLDSPIEISVEGIDESPTIRRLLSRLVGQMAMWNASVANARYDFDVETEDALGSMRERLAQAGPAFLELVRRVREDDSFDETFLDATCDPPEVFTYGGMIAHVLTYAAHRRTLVAGALASAGIDDLHDDPLVWLAAR